MANSSPFWTEKTLSQMDKHEWESLCDGCGKCCVLKMEDEDTGNVYMTDIGCRLFDEKTCRCKDYPNRKSYVPDCVILTAENTPSLKWMPQTCAYRLISEGKDLYDWHPLVSGSAETIHEAGMSVKNAVINEENIDEADHLKHVVYWPGEPEHED